MGTGEASGKKKEVGYVCIMTFSSILFGSPNSKANLKIISLFIHFSSHSSQQSRYASYT